MPQASIQTELFVTLVQRYEQDPREFVTLPQQTVDSSVARIAVAELRNEGYVEEQIRGVVRLTPRGYQVYQFQIAPIPSEPTIRLADASPNSTFGYYPRSQVEDSTSEWKWW